jgi:hypothetical protein
MLAPVSLALTVRAHRAPPDRGLAAARCVAAARAARAARFHRRAAPLRMTREAAANMSAPNAPPPPPTERTGYAVLAAGQALERWTFSETAPLAPHEIEIRVTVRAHASAVILTRTRTQHRRLSRRRDADALRAARVQGAPTKP